MKTAISLPDPLFQLAEKLSHKMRISRSQLYATALAEFLAKHSDKKVTEKLNALYEYKMAALDPLLADAQRRALRNDPW
jgi:hypothetical protein